MSNITKTLPYVIAAAAAIAAGNSANALPISSYAANASTNVNVYLSGSTAIDNTLLNVTTESSPPGGVCQPGTLDVYYTGTVSGYSNRLFYCTASANSGIAAGTPLAIFKESVVGSANGVIPLLNQAAGLPSGMVFINPAAIAADGSCGTTTTISASGTNATYTNHEGCAAADVQAQNSTGGFADVEAGILRKPDGTAFNNLAVSNDLVETPDIDVIWAITLTKNFYYALQAAEGLGAGGTVKAGCNTANNDAATCAPSLTKAQVAGIFSGNLLDSRELGVANGTTGDTSIHLCRRDKGSGTEASFEAYWLGQRCSTLVNASMLNEGVSTADLNYPYVWASGATSGVRGCLQSFNSGGTLKAYYTTGLTYLAPGNQYALGIMSSEIKPTDITNAGDSFRVVAIDGYLPTVANAVNGFYPYWSSGAAYVVKPGLPGAPSGSALLVRNQIVHLFGLPAWVIQSNASYYNPATFGDGGDMSPADQYFGSNPPTLPATTASVKINPTNAFTKNGSNCNTPIPKGGAGGVTAVQAPAPAYILGTAGVNQ